MNTAEWERMWAPYDEPTYHDVLEKIRPDDRVLDIGAGDLRLTRRIATKAQRVYAIEIQAPVLEEALFHHTDLPGNLDVIHGDAREIPFPLDITVAILLMRHCMHFRYYADKLKNAGCRRLITNARWRLGVEEVLLQPSRLSYNKLDIGWFACWCGTTGFKPGPPERLTPGIITTIHEVIDCPSCR